MAVVLYVTGVVGLCLVALMLDTELRALRRRVEQMDKQLQAMEGRDWLKRSREARGKEGS